MLLTILIFLLILSFLVLIHEAGHFFMARKFGIKVEEFGFGFPPRVWGIKRGETLYSINLLPIGGFVRLYGEDEAGSGKIGASKKITKDLDRAYFSKPIYQRFLVIVAGVIVHFVFALIISTYLVTTQGTPTETNQVMVGEVLKGSPAYVGGLKPLDIIEEVGRVKVTKSEQVILETRKHLGEKISLKVLRDGSEKTLTVTPRKTFPKDQGPMGVSIGENLIYEKIPFPKSIFVGSRKMVEDSGQVIIGFKNVVFEIITKFTVPQGVAGPLGMMQLTGEVAKIGPVAVLSLIYMLSLSLAVLNVLPIPALDGGRLFFLIIEAVTRRKMNPKYEAYANAIGIALLLSFMAVVSYKDILRLIEHQSILPQ